MQTPTAPGAQPLPCACQTACRMHFRTPSSVRSARPRCGSSTGSEYCAFVFSQPPPFRISLISIVVALPLVEVDDRRAGAEVVAGVLAGDRVDRVRPQLAAPGRLGDRFANLLRASRSGWRRPASCTSKVGMPVSWQIAPSPSAARSMFCAMIVSACDERVAGRLGDRARASSPRARRAAGWSRSGRSAAGRCRRMKASIRQVY